MGNETSEQTQNQESLESQRNRYGNKDRKGIKIVNVNGEGKLRDVTWGDMERIKDYAMQRKASDSIAEWMNIDVENKKPWKVSTVVACLELWETKGVEFPVPFEETKSPKTRSREADEARWAGLRSRR